VRGFLGVAEPAFQENPRLGAAVESQVSATSAGTGWPLPTAHRSETKSCKVCALRADETVDGAAAVPRTVPAAHNRGKK
jgi:hypothetical protein